MKTLLLLTVLALPALAQQRTQPNVILIMTDDQGYGELSCHGNPILKTPNLDQLHARSLRLTDYHAAPMCTPTRGQLLTGTDAARNGAINVSSGRALLSTRYATMAEVFRQNGYRTGLFGKWHLGDNYPYRPEDRGFQEALWFPSSHIGSVPDFWGNDYTDDTYLHNGNRQAYTGYCTDVFFENAMNWMAESARQQKPNAARPFFTYLPLNAPHSPLHAPDADIAAMKAVFDTSRVAATLAPDLRHQLLTYLAMIRNIDTNVGRLMAFLTKNNLLDNTILIFTTDNGSTYGNQYFPAGMRGKKTELWEGGHRVPFFVSWPKGLPITARDLGGLAQAQDVLPTLIDLCGLKNRPDTRFDGISLAPALRRNVPIAPERMLVINYSRMPWQLDFPSPDAPSLLRREGAAVLWKRWRLLEGRELYDLTSDPLQQTNVIGKYPDVAARLNTHLDRWWDGLKATANDPQPVPIGDPKANPMLLTACEWLDVFVDQQSQIVRGTRKNSYWNLTVEQPGTYQFELRRWPREADRPLAEGEGKQGALPIAQARIFINQREQIQAAPEGSKAVTFTATLPKGPSTLHTWFLDAAQNSICGAYYVYVTRKN
jgi:arylsulfatase A-like enzyme